MSLRGGFTKNRKAVFIARWPMGHLVGRAPWEGQLQQQEQVKSITELPSSPSSQSTVSFLPIYIIRYQW